MDGDGAKDDGFEVMVDGSEFAVELEETEFASQRNNVEEKKCEPNEPSKLRDTGEDINVGPSQYSFLEDTARREQEMVDAEDDSRSARRFSYRDRLDEMKANEENAKAREYNELKDELDKLSPQQLDLLKQVLEVDEIAWNSKKEHFTRYFGARVNK